jgi:prevent-host-death family protein
VNTLHLREAKARLSALVEAAERGEATIITKHGRAAAMLVPVEAGRRLFESGKPSFADYLLGFPVPLEVERDQAPLRETDL